MRLVELLDNYDYKETIALPSASALGEEVGFKTLEVLERLSLHQPVELTDELIAIALATRYPIDKKWLAKKSLKTDFDTSWLTDEYVDITDYLLCHTLDCELSNGTSTFNSIVLTTLYWFLTRESTPLSTYLKSYELNTTYGGFMVSDYLTYLR